MPEEYPSRHTHRTIYMLAALCAAIVVVAIVGSYSRPPEGFAAGAVIHVEKNTGLSQVGNELYDGHIIRSALLFRIAVTILGAFDGRRSVAAGDYFFKTNENVLHVAYRLVRGEQDITPVKVTFPEGITLRDMANILSGTLDGSPTKGGVPDFIFDEKEFLALASTSEGYLFPDTYLFLPNVAPSDVIAAMKDNFNEKIAALAPVIVAFQASTSAPTPASKPYPRTLANIVTMASILEREATSTADRRIIAGILWKRLDAGVPIQVDAPFYYILGKTSAEIGELTAKDLATTSPYNTYVHTGLPPTPIGNPGLDSLTDTVTPVATNYWYYVSDKNGVIHYAVTYAEQEANVAKYVE